MKVALGVSGGIACYKSAEILRRLQDRGVEVVVLMTKGATQFVTPLTFRALSGNKVYVDIFEGARSGADFEGAFDHILVAHSTDLFLVAPATADCIARLAIGLADDFLTTFHLAVTAPVVVAPAMNTRMWEHASVRANIERLKNRGVHIIEPEVGQMACRTYGPGRLAPVEDIDPVRYISNRSSGKMGYALAQAAQERGAQVTLVSGPIADATELHFPNTVHVRTTEEMRRAVVDHAADAEVVIKAAAPLDFRPKAVATQKIKKKTSDLTLEFEPTIDILKELGNSKNGKILVGFAAETENHFQNGLEKLKSKNLDLIVVNPASGPDSAFDSDMNHATIIDASGQSEEIPLVTKHVMADRILDRVVQLLK